MASHSNILAWKNPTDRSLAGYDPKGRKESNMIEHKHGQAGMLESL